MSEQEPMGFDFTVQQRANEELKAVRLAIAREARRAHEVHELRRARHPWLVWLRECWRTRPRRCAKRH